MMDTTERKPRERFRIAGAALLLLAALMFIGSFVAASKTPIRRLHPVCPVGKTCDAGTGQDLGDRQKVFFLWMGATLIVFAGGVWLRSDGDFGHHAGD
jgi:hypothetical protein